MRCTDYSINRSGLQRRPIGWFGPVKVLLLCLNELDTRLRGGDGSSLSPTENSHRKRYGTSEHWH